MIYTNKKTRGIGPRKGKLVSIPKSLYGLIATAARQHPKKTALITCNENGRIIEEVSCKELLRKVESAATYLHSLDLRSGDRVALAFGNSAELLILSWAAWSSGIVTVPLDVKRDTKELYQFKIEQTKAKVLIMEGEVLKNSRDMKLRNIEIREFTKLEDNPKIKIKWKNNLSHLSLVLFTSGTTAFPKGSKLTLQNLIINADGILRWLRITNKDRFMVNLPLHHINSVTFCLSTLLAGGSIAIPPMYSNSRFWQQAAKTRATFTSIVQSIAFDQLNRTKEYARFKRMLKLDRIQIGSAPVVVKTAQEFMKKFHIPLYQGYGQTETALRVTGVPVNLSKSLYEKLVEENSIGKPMSWAQVEIADEKGNILGENEEGELIVRGKAVMEGYVGNEKAFRDGFFLSGDIGYYRVISGERYFLLKGRKKEIIIKGGINISPIAVENNLKKISRDIDQVYVIPVPDKRYGEEAAAVICWKEGIDADRAKQHLKCALLFDTSILNSYERPKYIISFPANKLPVTSTGKVQRIKLRGIVGKNNLDPVNDIIKTPHYRFSLLTPRSPYFAASLALHNKCWQPLTISDAKYKKDLNRQFIIMAVDNKDELAGQIAFVRSNTTSDELLHTKYSDLLSPEISNPLGTNLVCLSICSAEYHPKPPIPVDRIPDTKEVRTYIREGHDPVYNFHERPKGGLQYGAKLVGVIPKGRTEDRSSLGYNMLLKYPRPKGDVKITGPVPDQLVGVALSLAKDLGLRNVYAYSRPGGLASYISKNMDRKIIMASNAKIL